MVHYVESRPIRTVLQWQIYVSGVIAVFAGFWGGIHGSISAALGGWVSFSAGLAYGIMISQRGMDPAGGALRVLIRAEASKIALIVIQLWVILAAYKQLVPLAFFSTFVIAVLIFGMAFFVRD